MAASTAGLGVDFGQPDGLYPRTKPIVIGIYGVSGCGKNFLMRTLQRYDSRKEFRFYDGSDVLKELAGGWDKFKALPEKEKADHRARAITKIQDECENSGKKGTVTGHYMLWDNQDDTMPTDVWTDSDTSIYTHIVYLEVSTDRIYDQRANDKRMRPECSIKHLAKWQAQEIASLRDICLKHGILFYQACSDDTNVFNAMMDMMESKWPFSEEKNLEKVRTKLSNGYLGPQPFETVVFIDGDKTLIAEDTGKLFWDWWQTNTRDNYGDPLRTIFSNSLKYSSEAFWQVAMLLNRVMRDHAWTAAHNHVMASIKMRPEFKMLLQRTVSRPHVRVVIATCGYGDYFTRLLIENDISPDLVHVMGNGVSHDDFVMTPVVKKELVCLVKGKHARNTIAFGDSPLDIEMLREADEAIVIVGEDRTKSRSMHGELRNIIKQRPHHMRQICLPAYVKPRLPTLLPIVSFADPQLINSVIRRRPRFVEATHKNATALLSTPTRDANVSGPALREAHAAVGRYLALEYVVDIVGTETTDITHVTLGVTAGVRLWAESQTLIVPLMRGGEPLAMGVSDVFPLAEFLHVKHPNDITKKHLEITSTLILVDFVINTGKSLMQFIRDIRTRIDGKHKKLHIVVVAGVLQSDATKTGDLADQLNRDKYLDLITLRRSDTKFVGKGTTDTGNRLFNTTRLD